MEKGEQYGMKDEEEPKIMWLNQLPPGVKIPLTAQQMAKVIRQVKITNTTFLISTDRLVSRITSNMNRILVNIYCISKY